MQKLQPLAVLLCLVIGGTVVRTAAAVSSTDCPNAAGFIQIGALMLDPVAEKAERGALYNDNFKFESTAQIQGIKLWEKVANKGCDGGVLINGDRYLFNLTIVNIGDTPGTATARNINLTKAALKDHPEINFWVGPYGSTTTTAVAGEIEKFVNASQTYPKLLVTTGATSSTIFTCPKNVATCEPGGRRFQRTFGPVSIAERYYVPAVNLFRNKAAKTVGFIWETSAFGTSLYLGSKAEALNNKINVTFEMSTVPSPNAGNISVVVDAVIKANPDIIICGWYYASSVELIRQFQARGYMPKGLVTRIGDINLNRDLGKNASYVIDANYWDQRLRGDDYIDSLYFPSNISDEPAPMQWYKLYNETYHSYPGQNYEGVAFVAGQIFHRAIERAKSLDPTKVREAMTQLQFTSFWGKVTFNALGYNELFPFAQIQYDDNAEPQIVYPLIASTVDMIYPIPLWDERFTKLFPYWQTSEQAIVGIAGVLMAISVALMLLVVILRDKHRVIKAASPPFLLLFLLGSLLLYAGVIMWALYVTTAICNAVAWMLSVGFVVMFGSLFGRTFRILQIISKSKYQPVKFTNQRLLVFVAILVAIDVIVLIIWTSAVPIKAVLVQPDHYRPVLDFQACQFQSTDYIFVGILGAYKLLIMIAGLFFSVKIWNFRMSEFNESKPIAFGMYNLIFFMILAIISVSVFEGVTQRVASYVLRSVSIMLATLITVLVIMMPKVHAVYKIPPGTESSRATGVRNVSNLMSGRGTTSSGGYGGSSYGRSATSSSDSDVEVRLAKLQKEFDVIKKANAKLKEDNANLRKELNSLKAAHGIPASPAAVKKGSKVEDDDDSHSSSVSDSDEEKKKPKNDDSSDTTESSSVAAPKMKKDKSKDSVKMVDVDVSAANKKNDTSSSSDDESPEKPKQKKSPSMKKSASKSKVSKQSDVTESSD